MGHLYHGYVSHNQRIPATNQLSKGFLKPIFGALALLLGATHNVGDTRHLAGQVFKVLVDLVDVFWMCRVEEPDQTTHLFLCDTYPYIGYVCIYIYVVHVYIYTYIYIYTRIYICIHVYIIYKYHTSIVCKLVNKYVYTVVSGKLVVSPQQKGMSCRFWPPVLWSLVHLPIFPAVWLQSRDLFGGMPVRCLFLSWLVVLTILKNISQWEGSHILWKIQMFETTNQLEPLFQGNLTT